jgi:tRNA threonylcarbamoyladenosine biosynthesis protein TsaB
MEPAVRWNPRFPLCHAEEVMETSPSRAEMPAFGQLLLAIDTCGPTGSVALARLHDGQIRLLGQIELEGRSYSATLVTGIADLLTQNHVELTHLAAIVTVSGPGSFTGVRVGLSTVKGLAEPAQIPVVCVSRLEVLAWKSDIPSAAIDAHRNEIFLRLHSPASPAREFLASQAELAAIHPAPTRVAVCDEAAALLLNLAWPSTELVRTPAPTAADALHLCAPRVTARQLIDLAILDGHYLRRSDAEIFGEPAASRV